MHRRKCILIFSKMKYSFIFLQTIIVMIAFVYQKVFNVKLKIHVKIYKNKQFNEKCFAGHQCRQDKISKKFLLLTTKAVKQKNNNHICPRRQEYPD